MQIATEVAGQSRGVKIRIRGIGSGFVEMFNQELQEPLHFNVSAENEEFLAQAVDKVQELVARVKLELESQPQAPSFKGVHSSQHGQHGQRVFSPYAPPGFGLQQQHQQQQQQFPPMMPSFAPQAPRGLGLPPPPPPSN